MLPHVSKMLQMSLDNVQYKHPRVQFSAATCLMNLGLAFQKFSENFSVRFAAATCIKVRAKLTPLINSVTDEQVKVSNETTRSLF